MYRYALALTLALVPTLARAVGPTVQFTLPTLNTTPSVFGSLPFPDDLYFDQGQPGDGNGTLLNTGSTIGLAVDVIRTNSASLEQALDLMDGFGTTTGIYFFLDGPIDPASLPASPVLAPSLGQSVFCADVATLTPVPIEIKSAIDTRIPNVLAIVPLPGRPLAAKTAYTCVVRTSVTGGGQPVEPSADWTSVRDGASANADADAIFDPVVSALGAASVPAASIAGMTVFTTQSTTADLVAIQDVVLPSLPLPTADFTSRPELVFSGPAAVTSLVGANPHAHVDTIATGYYGIPYFQTNDPNGDGQLQDLPDPVGVPPFATCTVPCETTDERFTRDVMGHPVVIRTRQIPFTVTIPTGTPPAFGWPIIIQQHGLGGQRDTVLAFAEADAAKGFASIGIDATGHGYRFFNCKPTAPCAVDTKNFVGGTAAPDGFVDNDVTVGGLSVGFVTVNLGFFQAFHNFLGIRDNFRQTYADLLSLVRLIHSGTIDSGLSTTIDDNQIFYMGHSLGGLMGSGFVPIEPDIKAALLNASGGGLTAQLFGNSSIGAGALPLVQGILGLDPANSFDQFALASNFTQMVVDPADGANSAKLLLAPVDGLPRNVLQVEDFGDQVVPNQANEALAVASGLPLFVPYVQNLHLNPLMLPLVATPRTVHANILGATAALLQNGPATHAASIGTGPGTLTFVPDFALVDEFADTGNAFPTLDRNIRVPNAGILDAVLDWFADVATNGTPGTFTFNGDPNFNPIENAEAPAGASTHTFFARTVSAGSSLATPEPTSDVTVSFATNDVDTRVTGGRSILGTSSIASPADVPPTTAVGTLGVLPFFATVQRELPGIFTADLTLSYTTTELDLAGVPPGSADEAALVVARFDRGSCSVSASPCDTAGDCPVSESCLGAGYTQLPTTVDTTNHKATTTGLASFSTFAVLHPTALAGGYTPPLVPGGGNLTTDCLTELEVTNPNNTPFLDRRGRVNNMQSCHDGDQFCDGDRTADGTCTFRIAVCFNRIDTSLASCTPDTTVSYTLRRPIPISTDVTDAGNAQALAAELVTLGATQGGGRLNVFTFSPALAGSSCTQLADVHVPVAGTGRKTIVGRAIAGNGRTDRDRLMLRCLP